MQAAALQLYFVSCKYAFTSIWRYRSPVELCSWWPKWRCIWTLGQYFQGDSSSWRVLLIAWLWCQVTWPLLYLGGLNNSELFVNSAVVWQDGNNQRNGRRSGGVQLLLGMSRGVRAESEGHFSCQCFRWGFISEIFHQGGISEFLKIHHSGVEAVKYAGLSPFFLSFSSFSMLIGREEEF